MISEPGRSGRGPGEVAGGELTMWGAWVGPDSTDCSNDGVLPGAVERGVAWGGSCTPSQLSLLGAASGVDGCGVPWDSDGVSSLARFVGAG